MLDIGWTELLVIGVVALIVVGPKDLPGMFRTLGRFTGKMKGMARDFQRAMNDAAEDAGASDLKKMGNDLRDATSPRKMGLDRLNKAADRFEKWDPAKSAKGARATDEDKPHQVGPATQKLAEERQAAAEKLKTDAARRAADRVEREAQALDASDAVAEKAPASAAKPAAKAKTAAKPKTAAKTGAAAKAKTAGTAAKTPRKTPAKSTAKPAAKTQAAKKANTGPKTDDAT